MNRNTEFGGERKLSPEETWHAVDIPERIGMIGGRLPELGIVEMGGKKFDGQSLPTAESLFAGMTTAMPPEKRRLASAPLTRIVETIAKKLEKGK